MHLARLSRSLLVPPSSMVDDCNILESHIIFEDVAGNVGAARWGRPWHGRARQAMAHEEMAITI
jgi:hypothetical protein